MAYPVKGKVGGGRAMNWEPDQDSQMLLDLYKKWRLERSPRLSARTVETEICLLRCFVFASLSLGGPGTLRELRGDPTMIARVVRGEWDRAHGTLGGMLSSMLRLIDLTVDDEHERRRLRGEIIANLYVRPMQDRRWDVLPGKVGGSREPYDHGPLLSAADLVRLVEVAGSGSADDVVIRSRGIVALCCWSSVSTIEAKSLRWEQFKWFDADQSQMWCAVVDGVKRRGRTIKVWVLREAEAPLRALIARGAESTGPVFCPVGSKQAVSYWTVKETLRKALAGAGIANCDDLAIKRAYSTVLASKGLDDYEVRNALGVASMQTVDARLYPHRSAMAARVADEHRVLIRTTPHAMEDQQLELPFGLDDE
jgi:integrase